MTTYTAAAEQLLEAAKRLDAGASRGVRFFIDETPLTSREPVLRERVTPITCAAWCESEDGHASDAAPGDQSCMGETVRIPAGVLGHGGDLDLYLERERETGGTPVRIILCGTDGDVFADLTLEDAARLRDALTGLLGAA